MKDEVEITLQNGRKLPLKLNIRTEFRLDELGNIKPGFSGCCKMIWALQNVENPNNTPEDIAELLDLTKVDEYAAAIKSVIALGKKKQKYPIT